MEVGLATCGCRAAHACAVDRTTDGSPLLVLGVVGGYPQAVPVAPAPKAQRCHNWQFATPLRCVAPPWWNSDFCDFRKPSMFLISA